MGFYNEHVHRKSGVNSRVDWNPRGNSAAVAAQATGRYPAGVRFFSPHMAMVLLVVTRLMLGEFAYSMPHASEDVVTDQAAAQSQDAPCPDHADKSATDSSADSDLTAAKHHAGAGHDGSCCKTTCFCACLHLSAIVTPCSVENVGMLDQYRRPVLAIGPMQDRVSVLLRPPA